MSRLALASLIWACSFGLIKRHLAGVDALWVAALRLALSALVFVPFIRLRGRAPAEVAELAGIGAVQFGLMYLAYLESFRHLAAHQVALLTLTTPLLVTLLADLGERRFRPRALAAAALAVAGTALVVARSADLALTARGALLVQGANLAFAAGQLWYRRWARARPQTRDLEVMGLLYLGGLLPTLPLLLRSPAPPTLGTPQLLTLAYLGIVASGLGFHLWNAGARRADTGTLAVMNNAKVPLGVACSLLLFGESAEPWPLLASLLALTGAAWLARREPPS